MQKASVSGEVGCKSNGGTKSQQVDHGGFMSAMELESGDDFVAGDVVMCLMIKKIGWSFTKVKAFENHNVKLSYVTLDRHRYVSMIFSLYLTWRSPVRVFEMARWLRMQ